MDRPPLTTKYFRVGTTISIIMQYKTITKEDGSIIEICQVKCPWFEKKTDSIRWPNDIIVDDVYFYCRLCDADQKEDSLYDNELYDNDDEEYFPVRLEKCQCLEKEFNGKILREY